MAAIFFRAIDEFRWYDMSGRGFLCGVIVAVLGKMLELIQTRQRAVHRAPG